MAMLVVFRSPHSIQVQQHYYGVNIVTLFEQSVAHNNCLKEVSQYLARLFLDHLRAISTRDDSYDRNSLEFEQIF